MNRFRRWLCRRFDLVDRDAYLLLDSVDTERSAELEAAKRSNTAVIACRLEDEARYAASAAELRKTLDKFIDELAAKNRQICELDDSLKAMEAKVRELEAAKTALKFVKEDLAAEKAKLAAAKDREKVHLKMLRDRERPRRDTKTGRYAKRCSP